MNANRTAPVRVRRVGIPSGKVRLEGELALPEDPAGLVLLAHGSVGGREGPRGQTVARELRRAGLATLIFELQTPAEDSGELDVGRQSQRLIDVTIWAARECPGVPIGYLAAGTEAAAALVAAAGFGDTLEAVVSCGGRTDLAGPALPHVRAATLLLVGGRDPQALELNLSAVEALRCSKQLLLIPGATRLFEEPGTLEETVRLAAAWFLRHFTKPREPELEHGRAGVSARGDLNHASLS